MLGLRDNFGRLPYVPHSILSPSCLFLNTASRPHSYSHDIAAPLHPTIPTFTLSHSHSSQHVRSIAPAPSSFSIPPENMSGWDDPTHAPTIALSHHCPCFLLLPLPPPLPLPLPLPLLLLLLPLPSPTLPSPLCPPSPSPTPSPSPPPSSPPSPSRHGR
ncbi:unnamed protein product [Closterium sp. NIES-53]